MIQKAQPIWHHETCVNQFIEVKQSFSISNNGCAYIEIAADTEYAAYINGIFVGTGQYRTFTGTRAYDSYDISTLIKDGENELLVTAYSEGEDTFCYQKGTPMLAYAVVCGEYVVLSGTDALVRVHPNYQSGEIEKVTPQLGHTFHYYANGVETAWERASVVSENTCYIERPVKKLVHQPIVAGKIYTQGVLFRSAEEYGTPAELMQKDALSCRKREEIFDGITLKRQSDGAYFVIDLEKEYAGHFTMDISCDEGTVIDIGWGEHLEDMRVRTSVGGRCFACRYRAKSGRQTFTGCFRRTAGRYIEIHITNMTGDVAFHQIGLIPTVYPLDRIGSFECSDYLMNRICQTAEETLKLCMHEHYEDCPWREQALYGFDSYLQMLCGYYLFGEYDFAKASLKLMADGIREDGLFPICAPTGSRMTIPSFCLSWILSLEKYVLYSGDIAFGKAMLPASEAILGAFDIQNGEVMLNPDVDWWHFYEWTAGLNGRKNACTDSPSGMYYLLAYEAYQRLCTYAGEECSPKIYGDLPRMREAIREKYYLPEKGFFKTHENDDTCHELTQALAWCSGVATDKALLKRLIQRDNGLVKATLSTSFFKYEALLGQNGEYLDEVTQEIAEIWGAMLWSGASTFWEVSEGAQAFNDAGSLCHGWSAIPIYLFFKYYAGFEPLTPGFKTYKLSPVTQKHFREMKLALLMPGKEKTAAVIDGRVVASE